MLFLRLYGIAYQLWQRCFPVSTFTKVANVFDGRLHGGGQVDGEEDIPIPAFPASLFFLVLQSTFDASMGTLGRASEGANQPSRRSGQGGD